MKTFDFNKIKKQYMTVKLPDDENTTLMLTMPTKNVMDMFVSINDALSNDEIGEEAIDELYDICSTLLSRNKAGIKITPEKCGELLDFEDIILFIQSYSEFISDVTNAKN